jgi:peptidoglycan/LPS O-acetylase OafA/YrhL
VSHHVHGVNPSSGSRLVGIEGLRALAASSIVLFHVWTFSTPGGVENQLGTGHRIQNVLAVLAVGVTLFFTLSGFLLYRPFAAAIARGVPHLPVGAYLRNRVLRIVPAYWVILLASALILGAAGVRIAHETTLGAGRITDPFDLLQVGLLLQDYRPSTLIIGIGPAWSLAVEAVFYLALPVMVLAVARLARRAKDRRGRVLLLLGPPLLLLAVGLTGKAMAAYAFPADPTAGWGNNWHSVIERSFWAQADLFTFGMLLAVLHTEVADGRVVLPAHWRRIAVSLALLIFLPCAWTMHHAELSYLLQNTGEALAIALAFSAIVLPDPNRTQPLRAVRVLESPALVGIGLASYSLFLWHQPVTIWLRDHGLTVGGWGGLLVNLAMVAAVAGGLSALTYRFVEVPALRRKHSTRVTKAPAAPPVTTASAERRAHVSADDRAVPAPSYPAAGG